MNNEQDQLAPIQNQDRMSTNLVIVANSLRHSLQTQVPTTPTADVGTTTELVVHNFEVQERTITEIRQMLNDSTSTSDSSSSPTSSSIQNPMSIDTNSSGSAHGNSIVSSSAHDAMSVDTNQAVPRIQEDIPPPNALESMQRVLNAVVVRMRGLEVTNAGLVRLIQNQNHRIANLTAQNLEYQRKNERRLARLEAIFFRPEDQQNRRAAYNSIAVKLKMRRDVPAAYSNLFEYSHS